MGSAAVSSGGDWLALTYFPSGRGRRAVSLVRIASDTSLSLCRWASRLRDRLHASRECSGRRRGHSGPRSRGEAPKEWRRALRAKTKQVRRSLSYQDKAIKAASAGRSMEAHRRLDQAEEILRGADGSLGVEFLGPSLNGFLDLWKWVMRGV